MEIEVLIQKLKEGNISLSRWGDGEIFCMFGRKGVNTDGTPYSKTLGAELRRILDSEPEYYIGMRRCGYKNKIDKYLSSIKINETDALTFVHANGMDGLGMLPFFEYLQSRKVIIVGPEYLKPIKNKIEYFDYVSVHHCKSWAYRFETHEQCNDILDKCENVVVLFIAGMVSCHFVDYFYDRYGDKHSFIDIGSSFDPWVGVHSRSKHHLINIPK